MSTIKEIVVIHCIITDVSNSPGEQVVTDGHTALTAGDLELLRKEFGDDFTELLLPGYQVNLVEVLGEGTYICMYVCTYNFML